MKYISLFSGIGGFDLGFDRAGMTCVAQVEKDEKARAVLAKHWPDVQRFDDVKEFNYGKPVDLIAGGFPCQDVSVAGRRAGLAGERSGLWHEFHRIIASLRPRWVVIENVPGLLSSNEGKDFAVILRGLVECGYGVAWRILDAQYFGVPQRRRRVFIVGSLGDGRAAEVLFEREGLRGDTPPSREAGKGFAPIAGTLAANGGGLDRPAGNANELDFCIPDVANTLSGHNHRYNPTDGETFAVSGIGEYKEGIGTLRANGGGMGSPAIAQTLAGGSSRAHSDITSGQQDGNVIPVAWQQNTRDEVRFISGDGQIAGALSSQAGMKQQNYVGVRRLTPTECERLQGFPDGWTDGQADTPRYRQLGNAVAVPCAEWIGRRIMEIA